MRQESWNALTRALETYRHSVDLYRQVIETRAELARASRLRADARVPLTNGLAPSTNGHVPLTNGHLAVIRARDLVTLQSLNELTPREREVARLMALGYTNQQIANQLVVTRGTAANHVAHILAKLGVTNRTQVAARVVAAGSNGHTPTD